MPYRNFRNPDKVKGLDNLINNLTNLRNTNVNFKDKAFNKLIDNKFKDLQKELLEHKQKEII